MKNNKTTLTFTGDIGFDKYMDKKWEDEDLVSKEVLDFLHDTNHLIINVEGPLYRQNNLTNEGGVKALIHSMDPDAVKFFNKIKADIWNINNNHIMDAGNEGIESTLLIAKNNNVKTLGAGMNIKEAIKPVIIDEAGKIGLIGVGYERACRIASDENPGCINFSRMDLIKEAIEDVKSKCRWCVIVAHDGEEFTSLPMPYTRDRYLEYLNMGADIVIAHHPHVPMNYEIFDDNDISLSNKKAIFYSLGNFIFDTDYQRSQLNTEYGIILKLEFTEEDFSFNPIGIKIDRSNEQIIKCSLPDIFANVNEEEYKILLPLAAKAFIENTKRQLKYLKPDIYLNATDEQFLVNFNEPLRSGRVPGKLLDIPIVYKLSKEYDKEALKESKLEKVKEYMLRQIL